MDRTKRVITRSNYTLPDYLLDFIHDSFLSFNELFCSIFFFELSSLNFDFIRMLSFYMRRKKFHIPYVSTTTSRL